MQLAHPLKKRQILNELRLDFIGQRVMVRTLAFLRLLVSLCSKWNMLCNDGFYLLFHLLHLCMSQGLNTKVIIFLKLLLHARTFAVKLCNRIKVHNTIA